MKKLNALMSEYFEGAERVSPAISVPRFLNLTEAKDLPIAPSRSEWELLENPSRLGRTFDFKSREQLRFFLDEILDHESVTGHMARIIIDQDAIIIEVYTHDVNDITELDTEYAEMADKIFADAMSAYE
tara:strand:- start:452 stop:838 length:387 start_codon:yes stop_codon:yes gene_type:complete